MDISNWITRVGKSKWTRIFNIIWVVLTVAFIGLAWFARRSEPVSQPEPATAKSEPFKITPQ